MALRVEALKTALKISLNHEHITHFSDGETEGKGEEVNQCQFSILRWNLK